MEDDSDDENWNELEDDQGEEEEPVKCLFCEKITKSVEQGIKHLHENHEFDLKQLKRKFSMDQYSYIKMINFIRTHNTEVKEFQEAKQCFWDNEKYLKPIEYEPWLTFDFDDLQIEESTDNHHLTEEILKLPEYSKLKRIIENLTQQLKEKESLLEQAVNDITKMREGYHQLIEKENLSFKTEENIKNCVGNVPLKVDEGYFSSYSHYGIHHEMLSDEVRTSSYRDALLKNTDFIKGKSVLDVGCGTSILSMFASQSGASRIVAIDNSEIIYHGMEIARINNFTNIDFVKGRLEDTELPLDKFDIIVSEWMGYFLIFEGMLDSIIYARDRHLKLGGQIMPNRCTISLLGYGDEKRHQDFIQFWNNVYGFNMSCMQKEVLHEASIDICKSEFILTESEIIADYDLMKVDSNYSNFSYIFNLNVKKSGKLTSFVGYFDTFFDLPNPISFSTSPETKPTHWKQVLFNMKTPIDVKEGEIIPGKIICRRDIKDLRSLIIKIDVFGKSFNYSLN